MSLKIPAAAYYRMSSDRQETSIGDQRTAVNEWAAKNGYRIVREYVDEGISGWRNDREAFQRMIVDATTTKEFVAILCWDQDRFSRFPPLEANHYWYLLDSAGIHITTVAQGRLDFANLAGWLTASISQHGKSEYCRDLGRNVARGQRTRKLQGQWIGKAPYGYKLGESGFLELGDETEIAIVLRIFQLRTEGYGTKWIAKMLNRDGVPGPRSAWSSNAIRTVLLRETYLGHSVIGKEARGKYARVVDKITTVENVHPAIVPLATWNRAREVDARNQKKRHHGDGEGAPLGGLLICGDCGLPMHSHTWKTHFPRKLYECGTNRSKGGCFNNHLEHTAIHDLVYRKIRESLGLDNLPGLRARLSAMIAARRPAAAETRSVEKQLRAIDAKITNATERLVSVRDSLVSAVETKLAELQSQRAALLERVAPHAAESVTVDLVLGGLAEFEANLKRGRPSQIRNSLSRFVSRITINFEHWKSTPHRNYRRPVDGQIEFANDQRGSTLGIVLPHAAIPLTREELSACYRQHAWNWKGADATAT